MALTSPDNIWTPDSSDNYALTTDLAATADSIQDAITALRGNNAPTVRVANVAGRNAALAAHGTPTTGNPLIVFRADAGAGREIEYTTNGTLWHTLAAEDDTGWVNVPLSSGTGVMRYLADSGWVAIEFDVSRSIGTGATTLTANGALPLVARPGLINARGVSYSAGAPGVSSYVTPSGQVGVVNNSGASKPRVEGTIVYHV